MGKNIELIIRVAHAMAEIRRATQSARTREVAEEKGVRDATHHKVARMTHNAHNTREHTHLG